MKLLSEGFCISQLMGGGFQFLCSAFTNDRPSYLNTLSMKPSF